MERSHQETSLRALLEKIPGDSALARNKIAITLKFSNNASVMLKVKTSFSKVTWTVSTIRSFAKPLSSWSSGLR